MTEGGGARRVLPDAVAERQAGGPAFQEAPEACRGRSRDMKKENVPAADASGANRFKKDFFKKGFADARYVLRRYTLRRYVLRKRLLARGPMGTRGCPA